MRFQAEHVRFIVIGAEEGLAVEFFTGDLIDLLHILMGPHVIAHGSRKSVESRAFQTIGPLWVPGQCIKDFAGIHQLRHAAKFRTAVVAKSAQALISCEGADRGSVITAEVLPEILRFIRVRIHLAEQCFGHGLIFKHHHQVDDVRLLCPAV